MYGVVTSGCIEANAAPIEQSVPHLPLIALSHVELLQQFCLAPIPVVAH